MGRRQRVVEEERLLLALVGRDEPSRGVAARVGGVDARGPRPRQAVDLPVQGAGPVRRRRLRSARGRRFGDVREVVHENAAETVGLAEAAALPRDWIFECFWSYVELIGSGIGFLWYNTYPAQIFMGDIGSLTLGAILGILAVILRHELVFAIMAGVFVIETLSVAIQVISFKTRGKRVFLMAPIHHHYELKGWPEPKIIVRFWIVTLVLILIALATLKLR